jgi:hypothetical protein
MNRKSYAAILALSFLALSFLTGCGSSSSHTTPPPVVAIAATSGSGQNTTVGTAFSTPLVATVTTGGAPTPGVAVTFTAPASGASGTFASNSTATETVTTNALGVATSSAFTANTTAGADKVTAAAAGASTAANFTLTNTPGPASSHYSFYMSGQEAINNTQGTNFYALAGAVTFDSFGNVVAGEQDYNDAFGLTSPQPAGDTITGGKLTVSATTGQGTLTLTTNNPKLGVSGTETLGVQFANTKHALIVQFDGTTTSSGSLDLQTLPSTLSGDFSLTLNGVDPLYQSFAIGGVFSINGTSISNGVMDLSDGGFIQKGTAFTATISTADAFGRGSIGAFSLLDTPVALNYYIVGPEVIRIIDVDAADSASGSAFGQGASAGTFSDASLGSSVFGDQANPYANLYTAVGMFNVPAGGTLAGMLDFNQASGTLATELYGGNYSIASNGYGSLNLTGAVSISAFGIYMTDPNLNLIDPNNTASGLGGGLLVNLDLFNLATGIVLPQTDTSSASFAGNYAFGAHTYDGASTVGWEYDSVGQGSVTGGVLAGTGSVSDPFLAFNATKSNSGVTFSGTATPDPAHAGRYTIPLTITVAGAQSTYNGIIYQASGAQLLWMNLDLLSDFLGPVEQQGSLAGLPAARRAVKTQAKK